MRTFRLALLTAAVGSLGACAPTLYFASGPGSCTPMQRATLHRPGIGHFTQKVQAVQARASLTARYSAANVERWRGAATGECQY